MWNKKSRRNLPQPHFPGILNIVLPHPPPQKKKLPFLMEVFSYPFNAWFIRPTRFITPNGMSVDSAVFPEFTVAVGGQYTDL